MVSKKILLDKRFRRLKVSVSDRESACIYVYVCERLSFLNDPLSQSHPHSHAHSQFALTLSIILSHSLPLSFTHTHPRFTCATISDQIYTHAHTHTYTRARTFTPALTHSLTLAHSHTLFLTHTSRGCLRNGPRSVLLTATHTATHCNTLQHTATRNTLSTTHTHSGATCATF